MLLLVPWSPAVGSRSGWFYIAPSTNSSTSSLDLVFLNAPPRINKQAHGIELTLELRAGARPAMQLLLPKLLIIPLLLLQTVLARGPHVCLGSHLFSVSQAVNLDLDKLACIFESFESIEPRDVAVCEASNICSPNSLSVLRDYSWIVCIADAVSAVVVKNRGANVNLFREHGFGWIAGDLAIAIDDSEEDLAGHLGGC